MHIGLVTGRRVFAVVLLASMPGPRPIAAQAPADASDYSQEAVVIEQSRTLYRFETDGTGRREMYVRLKAQSEAGVQQFGQLIFGYNSANERPEIAFVRVRKPDGTVVTTPPESVQDLSSPVQRVAPIYTDFRQKHVTVQGLRPGDTLEFNVVTTVHTALAVGQFWGEYDFQRDAIVLDEQLDIDVPGNRPVTLKTRPGFDPSIKDSDGRRVYHWVSSHLKREDENTKDAKPKKPADELQVAAVRLTTFQSWEQVGRWYAALEASQRVPNAEVRKKAAELVAGRTSEIDKLEALYGFVATNFRYVSLSLGAGRYQPRPAADTLREQYGDCKDKHTLLASLIDAAGMKASAVLINSIAKLDPSFPSPSQFDHVITRAIVGGEEIWVDTTSEVAPFRLLMPLLRGKQALVVDAGGTPRLQDTPPNPPMKSLILQDIDGKLGDAGKLDAHVRMTFRGDSELLMRTVFRSTPAARWKDLLEELTRGAGTPGEVSNWKVADPAAIKDPFTIEFDLSASRFVEWTTSKTSVALPLAGPAATNTEGDSGEEGSPVKLGAAPAESSYKLRLQLPADVKAKAPLPVSLARDYAEYRTSYAITGSTLSAERIMLTRSSELAADRRQDYAAFMRVVAADARQSLALETSSPVTATAPAGLNASELNRSGYDALEAGNYAQAITLLKRVVELEPKDKVAWTNLGRAYLGLRQTDQAIEAFRKQIEVNPYDEYAYYYLGTAYVIQQRFTEAETAFQKQLEMNPLDKYTHTSLGVLYLERQQYERAVPELERAVALYPDNAWLQVQFGKAHLNLKHDAEAIAAFDRAVELSPTPTMWNDIAYELALRGVHLDRAQQYAESAVSSATAASRTLDIARADEKSMGVVKSLSAYWDTLGWVYFARGDISRAEPLVEAAWRLSQHAEVGDHLAQIYEKLGRRDDAVRLYAMALGAERPSDQIGERLAKLAGDKQKAEKLVDTHRGELAKMRTIQTAATGAPGTADFLLLMSPSSNVENVRFISGDESLKPFTDALQKASYPKMFPDSVPAKLLRRGVLSCPATGTCTFTLLLPEDAEPVK